MLQDPVKQQFTVKHNGADLEAGRYEDLAEVVVELDITRPGMAVLRFRDTNWSGGQSTEDLLAGLGWGHGDDLEVLAPKNPADDDAATSQTIFKGEIVALEFDHTHSGRHALIRAYDKSHRLHRTRQTKAYPQMKDSDIFSQVIGGHGLAGNAKDTAVVHAHVAQINQTDYEFLRWRAEENGYTLMVDERGTAHFGPAPNKTGPTLDTASDLWMFRPRLLAPAYDGVDVRAWDPKQKQEMIAHGTVGSTEFATLTADPSSLAGKLSAKTANSVTKPGFAQSELTKIANTLAERHAETFVEAEGMALGNADLRPGVTVTVKGVGATHDGKYQITSARHVLNHNGYRTHMVFSGLNDRSALALSSDGVSSTPRAGRIYGLVIGVVTQVQAKSDDGIESVVKVKFPWLDSSYESTWCRVMQFGAGKGRGALFMPEVNDEVIVGFEHGDMRSPFVLGGLYNGMDAPNSKLGGDSIVNSGAVVRRGYRSKNEHGLEFYDDSSKDGITLITGDNNLTIALDQTNTKITIDSKNGKIEIHSQQDISIKNDQGDISIEAGAGNINMKAAQAVSIQAQTNVDLKATAQLTAEGTAGATLKSSASTTVQGSGMLDLNSSGIAQLKGSLVKIN